MPISNEVSNEDFSAFILYMEEHAGVDWINDTGSYRHVNDWASQCGHIGHEAELILRAIHYYSGD